MRNKSCVQCGYCCTCGPCQFGKWDEARHQCQYLNENKLCDRYDYIRGLPPEYNADYCPAFGTGCCSPLFNTVRESKISSDSSAAAKPAVPNHESGRLHAGGVPGV